MCKDNQKVVQVNLNEFRAIFGEKTFDSAAKMASILKNYLEKGDNFTGTIVFTVNCRMGGIGNIEAFVQKRI